MLGFWLKDFFYFIPNCNWKKNVILVYFLFLQFDIWLQSPHNFHTFLFMELTFLYPMKILQTNGTTHWGIEWIL